MIWLHYFYFNWSSSTMNELIWRRVLTWNPIHVFQICCLTCWFIFIFFVSFYINQSLVSTMLPLLAIQNDQERQRILRARKRQHCSGPFGPFSPQLRKRLRLIPLSCQWNFPEQIHKLSSCRCSSTYLNHRRGFQLHQPSCLSPHFGPKIILNPSNCLQCA